MATGRSSGHADDLRLPPLLPRLGGDFDRPFGPFVSAVLFFLLWKL